MPLPIVLFEDNLFRDEMIYNRKLTIIHTNFIIQTNVMFLLKKNATHQLRITELDR